MFAKKIYIFVLYILVPKANLTTVISYVVTY